MDRLGINVLDPLDHPRGSSETIVCWAARKHSKPTHGFLMNHSWATHKKPINVGHLAMPKRFCFWFWLEGFSRLCALCWWAWCQSSWRQMPVRLLVPGRWPASQKYSKTFEFSWFSDFWILEPAETAPDTHSWSTHELLMNHSWNTHGHRSCGQILNLILKLFGLPATQNRERLIYEGM